MRLCYTGQVDQKVGCITHAEAADLAGYALGGPWTNVPRKIRELKTDLRRAGYRHVPRLGKRSMYDVRSRCFRVLIAILLSGYSCLSIVSTSSARTIRAGQETGPLAILVRWPNQEDGKPAPYAIALVNMQGRIVTHATAIGRSPRVLGFGIGSSRAPLPIAISASRTRVYFLDGNSTVRFLTADGATGVFMRLPIHANADVGFAVSPDARIIAYSVLQYATDSSGSRNYNGMRLYVQNLIPLGPAHTIFSSVDAVEWPIGWHHGTLVLAVGGIGAQNVPLNPYGAWFGYHIVDAGTAKRLATLCPDDQGVGLIGPAGVVCGGLSAAKHPCTSGNTWRYYIQDWKGHCGHIVLPKVASAMEDSQWVEPLSPDGTHVLLEGKLVGMNGKVTTLPDLSSDSVSYGGWIDSWHTIGIANSRVFILDIRSGAILVGSAITTDSFFGTLLGG